VPHRPHASTPWEKCPSRCAGSGKERQHALEFEHFFGTGTARSKITLLVVGHLPSELVDTCISALNPPDVVEQYMNWNCDAPDPGSE
jgi:hypothetical protein